MSNSLSSEIEAIAKRARNASLHLCSATASEKNQALQAIARGIESNRKLLKEENEKDLALAEENKLSEAMVDRLRLTHERIDGMVKGLRQLMASRPKPEEGKKSDGKDGKKKKGKK